MVALIVLVIDLAVEELEADRHAVLLSESLDLVQPLHAVGRRFRVAHAAPVAEEGNQVRDLLRRGERNPPGQAGEDLLVIGLHVQPVND